MEWRRHGNLYCLKKIKEPLDFKVFGYVSMLIFIASSVLMQYKLYFAVLDALE